MADGPVTPEMVRAAEAAVARPTGLAANSVEAQLVKDLNNANLVEGYNIAAGRQADYPAIDKLAQNNIGYKDHAGNPVRSAVETNLLAEVNGANGIIPLLRDYVEKGIDHASPAAQNYLVDNYARVILSSPQLAARFVGMTPVQADTEAKRIARIHLKDPRIQLQIADRIPQAADVTKPIEDKVTPAEAELHRLEQERDRLKDLYDGPDGSKTKHDAKKKAVDAYNRVEDPAHPGTFIDGAKYTELTGEETARAGHQAKVENLRDTVIPGIQDEIAQLEQDYRSALDVLKIPHPGVTDADHLTANGFTKTTAAMRAEITAKQGELKTKKGELTNAVSDEKKSQTKIDQLKAEKKQLEDQLKDLEAKMEKAKEAYEKAKDGYDKQKIVRDGLQKDKETLEIQWVDLLRKIVPDIASAELVKQVGMGVDKAKETMDKRAADSKDSGKKKFWEYEKQQYVGPDGRPNRAAINADRTALMRAGTDYVFTLADGSTPRIFLNGAEQTLVDVMSRGGMSNDEIYNLVKDPATRSEMSVTLAQDILTTFLWSGGRLSNQGEVIAIQRSEWGKGMIAKAMAGRADLQSQVDAVIGKGVLKWDQDLLAQLGKIEWSRFAMILLVLAGIVGGLSLFKRG